MKEGAKIKEFFKLHSPSERREEKKSSLQGRKAASSNAFGARYSVEK
jgi:hypothetical protein